MSGLNLYKISLSQNERFLIFKRILFLTTNKIAKLNYTHIYVFLYMAKYACLE